MYIRYHSGLLTKNLLATNLIGPLLIRNPALCRYVMDRLYEKIDFLPEKKADMTLQTRAYEVALRELSARIK